MHYRLTAAEAEPVAGRLSGLCGRGELDLDRMPLPMLPLVKRLFGAAAPPALVGLLAIDLRFELPSLLSVLAAPRTRSLIKPLYISESPCNDSRNVKLCVSNTEVDFASDSSSLESDFRLAKGRRES